MGGMVEEVLGKAITALIDGDSSLGESLATDDLKVNGMEVLIDEECSRILATRAPAAGDLRLIVAIIKTITDLERIGDEGEKIGNIASRLAVMERPENKYREVKHMSRLVAEMVHDSLDAFARMDAQAALKVARRDRMVDEEYESIHRQCITFMMEDPRNIRRTLDVMWIVRSLERVGDHAKNICEYVIFMVHGKDVPPYQARGCRARPGRCQHLIHDRLASGIACAPAGIQPAGGSGVFRAAVPRSNTCGMYSPPARYCARCSPVPANAPQWTGPSLSRNARVGTDLAGGPGCGRRAGELAVALDQQPPQGFQIHAMQRCDFFHGH